MIRGSGVDLARCMHAPLPSGTPVVVLAARLLADKGALVPVRDADALERAIQQLLADPLPCQAMGEAARALAERAFDVCAVVAAHCETRMNYSAYDDEGGALSLH